MIKNFLSLAGASAFAFSFGVAALPGAAHAGFLEQLFGIAPQAAPAPAPVPSPSYSTEDLGSYRSAPVYHRAKRKVIVDTKPKLQKPTDLMHDVTLRTGDAIMMNGGVHIYTGYDRDDQHTKADFEPLDAVRDVPKQERKALVAMDIARNDPLRGAIVPDTIASGRSAAVASPIVSGREIVDVSGKTIRYVGP